MDLYGYFYNLNAFLITLVSNILGHVLHFLCVDSLLRSEIFSHSKVPVEIKYLTEEIITTKNFVH